MTLEAIHWSYCLYTAISCIDVYIMWLSIELNDIAYRDISYIRYVISQHTFLVRLWEDLKLLFDPKV